MCDVLIGQIGPTFGRKGDVKVKPFTDHIEQFQKLKEVCLTGLDEKPRTIEIERAWEHNGLLIVKFAGINDIAAAESLRHAEVRISEAELLPLADGEYYVDDIIGLDVVTELGEDLGCIKEILRSAANDVYVTDKAMIPAVKDVILSIDLAEKKMVAKSSGVQLESSGTRE
jgi:16S rRNA processing protein RimM